MTRCLELRSLEIPIEIEICDPTTMLVIHATTFALHFATREDGSPPAAIGWTTFPLPGEHPLTFPKSLAKDCVPNDGLVMTRHRMRSAEMLMTNRLRRCALPSKLAIALQSLPLTVPWSWPLTADQEFRHSPCA